VPYDRATIRTHCYENLKPIGVHLAEISQIIKNRKLAIFGQARFDEHKNFISVGFEGHSVIWHKNILKNIKILKSHHFDNLLRNWH
jgi:hypothetical protein